MKLSVILPFIFLCSIYACKHNHPEPSIILKEAFNIQKEGIAELNNIDEMMKGLPENQILGIQEKKSMWQSNMIEIEGMVHDHSQCNGDHSKKRISISDEDMLEAQKAWRDSVLVLKTELSQSLN